MIPPMHPDAPLSEHPKPENRPAKRVLPFLLLCLFAGLYWYAHRPSPPPRAERQAANVTAVQLAPPGDLDGLTKAALYERRTQAAHRQPALLKILRPKGYAPSNEVFGGVVDGKPWWGTVGVTWYGPGPKSVEGPSREGTFVDNPFLLLGAVALSYEIEHPPKPAPDILPQPQRLTWAADGSYGWAVYSLGDYCRQLEVHEQRFFLHTYNARDMGFRTVAFDAASSPGVKPDNEAWLKQPMGLEEYLAPGPSCGVEGGCNNIQPGDLPLFRVRPPARACFQLRREGSSRPDAWFVLQFE